MKELAADIQQLIVESIESVEALEALLLLRRSPQTYWSSQAIGHQLGLSEETALQYVTHLCNAGLAVRATETSAYRFASGEAVAESVDRLSAAYSEQRIAVINAIYSESTRRLRAFSDAFRLRRD